MTGKEPKLIELLQLTLSAADSLESFEVELKAAKITLENVTTKLKYRCMEEDLKTAKKKR